MSSPLTPTAPRTLRFVARGRSPASPSSCITTSGSATCRAIDQAPSDNIAFETPSPSGKISSSSDGVVTPKPVTIDLRDLIHANYGGSRHAGESGQMVFNMEVVDGAPIELVVPRMTGVETRMAPPENGRVVVNITARGGSSLTFRYEGPEMRGKECKGT